MAGFASSTDKSANGPAGSIEGDEQVKEKTNSLVSSEYEEIEEEFEEEVEEEVDYVDESSPEKQVPNSSNYSHYKTGSLKDVETIEEVDYESD